MTAGPWSILCLHALGDFSHARRTSVRHLTFLGRYAPEHLVVYHDVESPVTPALRAMRFHAVVLDTTFLCMRYLRPRSLFDRVLERYAFVAGDDAVRLAFPQDEYDHGEILDEWLDSWRVDLVWSVVWNGRDLFLPRTSRAARILPALTGYVDDEDLAAFAGYARPFRERSIDVGYRARDLPPQFGRHGRLKSELGHRFAAAAAGRGLAIDVSSHPEDVLLGEQWFAFLGNSRYTLGCEGGSSVFDPRGEIRDRVEEYLREHPEAAFEEVESACFPGEDGRRVFSAVSPRLFEVAAAHSVQVLVPAEWLGVLRPDEHFIPLRADFGNVRDVLDRLGDQREAEHLVEAAHTALLEPERFRYRHHAGEVLAAIDHAARERGLPPLDRGREAALLATHLEAVRAHERRAGDRRRREERAARLVRLAGPVRSLAPASLRRALARLLLGRRGPSPGSP